MADLKVADAGLGYRKTLSDMLKEEQLCEQCKVDNNFHPSEGWCETCDELLCDECYKTHRRPKKMRDHQLYSIPDMKIRKKKKRIVNRCKEHGGELLKYFCEDHSELGCSQCFVTKHRPCNKVVSIAEVKTSESEEFEALEKLLSDLDTRLGANEEATERSASLTERQHDKTVADIEETGAKLKMLIDRLVRKLIVEAQTIRDDNIRIEADIKHTNSEVASKLQSSREMLAAEKRDNNQLFIIMKHLQKDMEVLDSKLHECEAKQNVKEYEFVLNPELASVLDNVKELGTLADTQILNLEKSTDEVVEEVRRFKKRSALRFWFYRGKEDAIQVSTDHDIQLLYVLLYPCLEGDTNVALTISEGGRSLISCNNIHKNTGKDVVYIKMVNEGGCGITLQAGRQYDVAVTIKGGHSCRGVDGQAEVKVEGVTFIFRETVSPNGTTVTGGQIVGFRFTRI